MFLDVPASLFGNDLSQYVYLYCKFGVQNANNDGGEEWAVGVGAPLQVAGSITTAIDLQLPGGGEVTGVTNVPPGSLVKLTKNRWTHCGPPPS